MKIYTRSGDLGQTSLLNGERVPKSSERVDLYGEVDELNSQIGLTLHCFKKSVATRLPSLTKEKEELVGLITEIQSRLFDLGSYLACPVEDRQKFKMSIDCSETIKRLEESIDLMTPYLPELKNFILPGGTLTSAQGHMARTICRRVERKVVAFMMSFPEENAESVITFLNRLSDFFFQFSRFSNWLEEENDIIWRR
jgi:cob(I)alamin adenosyltransferase